MSDSVGAGTVPAADNNRTSGGTGSSTENPGSGRLTWADSAKGLSIIGVCYMHVISGTPGAPDSAWDWFNRFMDPLRMPMFFLISGLFAHRVISRTLGDLWYRRIWFLLVPYLVFTPVQAAIRLDMTGDLSWSSMARAILLGDPGIWFLYALMVFNTAACLLRRVPPLAAVGLSVVPAVCAALFGVTGYPEIVHITAYMPAFFLGLHFRELYFRLAKSATDWRVILGAVASYAGWEWFQDTAGDSIHELGGAGLDSIVFMGRIVTSVPLGIVLAAWIARIPGLSTVFAGIGRHTLPIYVSHHAALHLVNAIIIPHLMDSDPYRWAFLEGMNTRIIIGFLTCAVSGYLFYLIGRVPVLRWVLYPPALPRRQSAATRTD